MKMNRVRVGGVYIYRPNMMDLLNAKHDLQAGEKVKVINLRGCPPANTMGHCYVARLSAPKDFVGMVHCNSLVKA